MHRLEEKKTVSGRKQKKCRVSFALFMIRLLKKRWGCSFSPHCHDTVADKSHSVCTMGGFEMVVNLIDKAKQWHNACRPITFLFV